MNTLTKKGEFRLLQNEKGRKNRGEKKDGTDRNLNQVSEYEEAPEGDGSRGGIIGEHRAAEGKGR